MSGGNDDDGFLSRWSRRKELVRTGTVVAPEPVPAAAAAAPLPLELPAASAAEPAAAEPLPTLDDVKALTRDSDYARFVAGGVDEGVKRAAMKKLFTDPHFNVMDGLDTYIDDYNTPDPIPLAMLRQMNQSKFLRLFDDDEQVQTDAKTPDAPEAMATATEPTHPSDDDADLRLQQDDAAGRPGPDQGPRA